MNEFVNFRKRNVELPPGCKDLVDVLQQAKGHPAATSAVRSAEGLGELGKHLLRLLELGAKFRYLVITWDEMNAVQLMHQDRVLTALAVVHEKTHREQAVRGVFGAASLTPILDEALAGWSLRMLVYRLPGGASSTQELISDLLRTGYGLAENAGLNFESWESDAY